MSENLLPDTNQETRDAITILSNRFTEVADNASNLIRINILVLGLFLPVLLSIYRIQASGPTPQTTISALVNRPITQIGLVLWTFSMLLAIYIRHSANIFGIKQYDPYKEYIGMGSFDGFHSLVEDNIQSYSKKIKILSNILTISYGLSAGSVFLLASGSINRISNFNLKSQTIVVSFVIFFLIFISLSRMWYANVPIWENVFGNNSPASGDSSTPLRRDDISNIRREVLRIIKNNFGREEFTNTELNSVLSEQNEYSIDSVSTTLLNRIADEDNLLIKTQSGGVYPFLVVESDKLGGTTSVKKPHEIRDIVEDISDEYDVDIDYSKIDFEDWSSVMDVVNNAVGEQIFKMVSNPNKYRIASDSKLCEECGMVNLPSSTVCFDCGAQIE